MTEGVIISVKGCDAPTEKFTHRIVVGGKVKEVIEERSIAASPVRRPILTAEELARYEIPPNPPKPPKAQIGRPRKTPTPEVVADLPVPTPPEDMPLPEPPSDEKELKKLQDDNQVLQKQVTALKAELASARDVLAMERMRTNDEKVEVEAKITTLLLEAKALKEALRCLQEDKERLHTQLKQQEQRHARTTPLRRPPHTEETRRKISEGNRGKPKGPQSEARRKKQSETMTIYWSQDETKATHSAGIKRYWANRRAKVNSNNILNSKKETE